MHTPQLDRQDKTNRFQNYETLCFVQWYKLTIKA